MQLDSLSSSRRGKSQQRLPQFLAFPAQRTEVVGELVGGGAGRLLGSAGASGERALGAGQGWDLGREIGRAHV